MNNYSQDREFLNKYADFVELVNGNAKVLISPKLQGRVVSSTSEGDSGYSYGWINYKLIESGKFLPHCNNFGGEDRFWIGPEGGQYSIFFKSKSPFDLEHWQTPAAIDTESWKLVKSGKTSVQLENNFELENYSGSKFRVKTSRAIDLLSNPEIEDFMGITLPEKIESVGFISKNYLTNTGSNTWTKETGLLSIWNLGQLKPSPENIVILPFNPKVSEKIVNDTYFGKIDNDRIRITNNHIFFKGDGMKRGKIGLAPKQTYPVIGSFDRLNGVLTIVKFSFDTKTTDYVNSMWELQKNPFCGDVVNSYNDGPLPDGTIMGPFYELETSSPALPLKPGEEIEHIHSTFHFRGNFEQLEALAQKLLMISLKECKL
jgi:hypothetical protein